MNETKKNNEGKAEVQNPKNNSGLEVYQEEDCMWRQMPAKENFRQIIKEVRYSSEFEFLDERLDYFESQNRIVESFEMEEEEIHDLSEQIFSFRTKRVANSIKQTPPHNQPKPISFAQLCEIDSAAQALYDVEEEIVFY